MTIRLAPARDRIVVLRGGHDARRRGGCQVGRRGRRATRRPGFSLLELVVSLSIIATLAAIAAPRYHGSVTRHRLELAAARVVADLELARRTAVVGGSEVRMVFDVAADQYELRGVADADRGTADTTVVLGGPPWRVDVVSTDFDGRSEVVFDPLGQPDSGGTMILRIGGIQRTVQLDASSRRGRVP